jgi:2-keto-4-pentenoate hydratase/2-oxohepta-3-ene-1,7-dioic acid hydratase in catechol pathway
MKLLSFERDGQPSYGCLRDNGIVDLGHAFGVQVPDLKTLIHRNLLGRAEALAAADGLRIPLADVRLLPVIPNPGKIVCVGLNYHDHVVETGRTVTAHPTLFLRLPESQAAHGEDLLLPAESTELDYEGEIAIIIGKPGRRISASHALEHVAGYACYNDGSVRDWQAAATQWTAGKNFPRTGAFGPWMVTADEVLPGTDLGLVTRLNGREVQRARTSWMIHGIAELIRHISTFTSLEPGDVIVTGTPGGVGFKKVPPVFLAAGDVVEVEIEGMEGGTLRNGVCREGPAAHRFGEHAEDLSKGR